jgi:hypothetical protein
MERAKVSSDIRELLDDLRRERNPGKALSRPPGPRARLARCAYRRCTGLRNTSSRRFRRRVTRRGQLPSWPDTDCHYRSHRRQTQHRSKQPG